MNFYSQIVKHSLKENFIAKNILNENIVRHFLNKCYIVKHFLNENFMPDSF